MGIYFIAAGSFTKNREKTLDKPHTVEEICKFLSPKEQDHLKEFFPKGDAVYVWGANDKNKDDLSQLKSGEYVVDVKNKIVVQIFRYCFSVESNSTRLQEYLGWDREKPIAERRPYRYVYFLKSPLQTNKKDKKYFQNAFNLNSNPQWLIGQKYFNDSAVLAALKSSASPTVEYFLGLSSSISIPPSKSLPPTISKPEVIIRRNSTMTVSDTSIAPPDWLQNLVGKVTALKNDTGHLERDHEDLVASLFELLGYERIHDIKFRRGNIDIRIEKNNTPWVTVEVKADWGLSPDSRGALSQAYNYANETGTPFVIITNGDRYCIYDRRQGISYEDNLIANIALTSIDQDGVSKLNLLRKEHIK